MLLSIVTAVRNRAGTLGHALGSLAAQSHSGVEHVIQDGASTDGTLGVIARRAPRARLESAPDGGIYEALNRGIARASGDVIGILHSDDALAHPGALSRVMVRLMADPSLDGVYGDLDYVSASGSGRVVRRWRAGAYRPGMLARGWMPPHPTLFVRREVIERHGAYDTSLRIAADYEAILRWLGAGVRLGYVPDVLVRMRMGGESNRSLGRMLVKSREDLRAMRRHGVGGLGTLAMKNLSKVGQFVPGGPDRPALSIGASVLSPRLATTA